MSGFDAGEQRGVYSRSLALFEKFHKMFDEVHSHYGTKDEDTGFRVDALLASITPELYVFTKENRGLNKDEIKQKVVRLYIDSLFNVK